MRGRTRTDNGESSKAAVRHDSRLSFVDQALYTQHRAIGRNLVIQCEWLYDHDVNLDGVRRFHQNLGRGLLARRIERSPIPFARHRWILDRGPTDIDIDEVARPRAELSDWTDERAQVPIDPEHGPGWHLGLVRLTDGSTAASLVLSHYLLDGLGVVLTLIDAVMGNARNLGYPPPRARPRLRAFAQDARTTATDLPNVVRALRVGARQSRQQPTLPPSPPPSPQPAIALGEDDSVVVPGITICIDSDAWDARANALGGTGNTLGAAFAAKLGQLIGRIRDDGSVTLELPVNERTEGDTRANAMSFARVSLDPVELTTDLGHARAAIKDVLADHLGSADDALQVAWLASYTPRRTFRRLDRASVADPDVPVFYSYLGDVGAIVDHLDGTPADWVTARVLAQGESRRWLERTGGQMILQSLRVPGRFVVTVNAYQPGAANTKPALRELAAKALSEFGLDGTVD